MKGLLLWGFLGRWIGTSQQTSELTSLRTVEGDKIVEWLLPLLYLGFLDGTVHFFAIVAFEFNGMSILWLVLFWKWDIQKPLQGVHM